MSERWMHKPRTMREQRFPCRKCFGKDDRCIYCDGLGEVVRRTHFARERPAPVEFDEAAMMRAILIWRETGRQFGHAWDAMVRVAKGEQGNKEG